MYRIPIYKVSLVRESSRPSEIKTVNSPSSAAEIMAPFFDGLDREQLAIAMLDVKHKVIGVNIVSVGCLDSTLVHPREVFKAAILSNAVGIIMAHNHPSGNTTPGKDDIKTTERIKKAGEILGIGLVDHIIIGHDGDFVSLKERGEL